MKKLYTLSVLLFLFFILFSCGDDKPNDLPVDINSTAGKSYTIIAAAGSTTSQDLTFTLEDFTALKDYLKYVESGAIQNSSYIEVKGVTEDAELTNVKLSLKSDSKKNIALPNINSNIKFDELPHLTFMQLIINELVNSNRKTSTVKLEYNANSDITSPLTITIYLNSRFSF